MIESRYIYLKRKITYVLFSEKKWSHLKQVSSASEVRKIILFFPLNFVYFIILFINPLADIFSCFKNTHLI